MNNGLTDFPTRGCNPIIKKLSKHGNSLALVIDRPILQLLGIDEDTPLKLTTDGQTLIVSPVPDAERQKRFEKALADGNKRFEKTLRKLAESDSNESLRQQQASR